MTQQQQMSCAIGCCWQSISPNCQVTAWIQTSGHIASLHTISGSPMCQLALFLQPLYRPAVLTGRLQWNDLRKTAGELWKSRSHSKAECLQLMQVDLDQYKLGDAPYNRLPVDGQLATLRLWWRGILHDNPGLQLPLLALFLLDIKPHAADPEKTFSLMGWFQSKRRSRMLNRTTTNMTMIKMHHSKPIDRYVDQARTPVAHELLHCMTTT